MSNLAGDPSVAFRINIRAAFEREFRMLSEYSTEFRHCVTDWQAFFQKLISNITSHGHEPPVRTPPRYRTFRKRRTMHAQDIPPLRNEFLSRQDTEEAMDRRTLMNPHCSMRHVRANDSFRKTEAMALFLISFRMMTSLLNDIGIGNMLTQCSYSIFIIQLPGRGHQVCFADTLVSCLGDCVSFASDLVCLCGQSG